ncbi:MAG: hypothetical protein ABIP77_02590 [Candidatus Limnocylindrales bacterium]
MSHPSLGLPPADQRIVHPEAARRVHGGAPRLAARALEAAIQADPTLRERNDQAGLQARLRDAQLLAERLSIAVGIDEPSPMREYAEMIAPVYRRKRVPMDDLIGLCEGLRSALLSVLSPAELVTANLALDEAIAVLSWHRRLAGDARRKNAFLQFLYKGG